MNQEELFAFRDGIENLLARHASLLGNEPDMLKREFSVDSTEKMKALLDEMRVEGRLLKLGIVGRVKAGKSSLLNALIFNGQDILPKASTPMTAALTQLSYGETLSAEVEFFTEEDIRRIKAEHDRYVDEFNRLKSEKFEELKNKRVGRQEKGIRQSLVSKIKDKVQEKTLSSEEKMELEDKAAKNAKRELHENPVLEASFDQYERIKKSGINNPQQKTATLNAGTIDELSGILADYVGSEGSYMPFTKSVEIHYPAEELKDLLIIDTPGINDPVQSREERTRELLKNCDAIFIVSPSGQFLSNEDTKLLDRIVAKEGINHIYFVASKIDDLLFGSEKDAAQGNLKVALENIMRKLKKELSGAIKNLVDNVGGMESLKELADENKAQLTYSSGISQSLLLNFDKKELWDDTAVTVWNNLKEYYRSYFSDQDRVTSMSALEMLANILSIRNIIHGVRENKNTILESKEADFIKKKSENILKFRDELLKNAKEQVSKINETDIDELKKQQKNIAKIKEKATIAITEDYAEILEDLKIKLKDELEKTVDDPFKELKKTVTNADEKKEESYTVKVEKKGLRAWFARKLDWGGYDYEERNREYTQLNAGAIYEELKDLTAFLETCVIDKKDEFMTAWRKNLYGRMFNTLRKKVDDDDIDLDIVRKVFRQLVNSIDFPELSYSGEIPESLRRSERLRDSARDEYLAACEEYTSNLKRRVKKDVRSFIDNLINQLGTKDPAGELFKGYEKQMEELENMINNKAVTLAEFKKLTDGLAKL